MVLNRGLLIIGFSGMLLLASAEICDGQQRRRYQPKSPTLSPYLNLLNQQSNPSGLPNYYSWVRPIQQQREFNTRESALRRQQERGLLQVQGDLQQVQGGLRQSQILVAPTGKNSWFMNFGTRSSFQNTSRYYSQVNVGRISTAGR